MKKFLIFAILISSVGFAKECPNPYKELLDETLEINSRCIKLLNKKISAIKNTNTNYKIVDPGEKYVSPIDYRVATHMLNSRKDPDPKSPIKAVYYKNQVLKLYKRVIRVKGDKKYTWAKTKKGWVYITDMNDRKVRREINKLPIEKIVKIKE